MKGAEFRPRASFTVPPQLLLDPRETGRTSTARSAPTRLPLAVREFGHLPDFDLWRPGDALLFSGTRPGFMQRRIVRAQRRLGYAPEHARWHHAGIYLGDRYVCEAVPGGVRYRPVVEFVPDYLIRARRGRGLDGEQAFRVAMRAVMRLSKPYSHWRAIRAWLGSWNSGGSSPWTIVSAVTRSSARSCFTTPIWKPPVGRWWIAWIRRCFPRNSVRAKVSKTFRAPGLHYRSPGYKCA